MKQKYQIIYTIIPLGIATLVGLIISLISELSFISCFLISIVSLIINGIAIYFEDKNEKD